MRVDGQRNVEFKIELEESDERDPISLTVRYGPAFSCWYLTSVEALQLSKELALAAAQLANLRETGAGSGG